MVPPRLWPPYPAEQLPALDAWLALTTEDALEPDLPIIDPHHHLWDWGMLPMSKRPLPIARQPRYLIEEISQDIVSSKHNVLQTVFIECNAMYRADGPTEMRPVGETEFVAGIAAMSASGRYGHCQVASGIVGSADLRLGAAVQPVLQAHIAASGGRFRGIRQSYDESGLLCDANFRKGFAVLSQMGLSFECWGNMIRLPDVADLASNFPTSAIVVDHLGGVVGPSRFDATSAYEGPPTPGPAAHAQWKADLRAVAACPNVFCKLGGITMPVNGFQLDTRLRPIGSEELASTLLPFVGYALDVFGPHRCMFESNFPVDRNCVSYTVLWNAYKRIARLKSLSDSDRKAVFHDTAARFYRLPAIERRERISAGSKL
eukprot:gnl/TRDRNA2_/TRDRNA2_204813_c0_seq1.p1 gnl/TRDRNA2_/TRDRNA2_204813_c0~~gnl/TRDRNA2_/TRDRNA2_204813_c0_seq1.p1  ORF type:complete len:374 (-),score=49.96 gnl/TRDRNA2_/TRDRNA2_204813_c0_seq1:160-1281(-)